LVAYSVSDKQVAELMRSGYTRYLATDLNGDEKDEVFLIQMDNSNPVSNRVEMYVGAEGAMVYHSYAPISEGAVSLQLWEAGYLENKLPSLMVTSEYGENEHITDVYYYAEKGLKNITLDEASRASTGTIRQYTGNSPMDINEDGITEIPMTKSISGENAVAAGAENFWQIIWQQYNQDGKAKAVLSTYHNNNDRWYLELPDQWKNVLQLSRLEHANIGERAVVFSYWTGEQMGAPVPVLNIYRLTGNNRSNHAEQDNRFILWEDSETIYAAEFLENDWDCGLDQKDLIARFHTM
jgi:hypothetical protein